MEPTSPSPSSQEAAKHLQAIRQLMENATVVQALTVRAAWFAGLASLILALADGKWDFPAPVFHGCWYALLLAVMWVNFLPLFFASRRAQQRFPSPVLLRVCRGMAPGLLVGFVGGLRTFDVSTAETAAWWVLGNGLGVLGASHLLPRQLVRIGAAFFLLGLGLMAWAPMAVSASVIMGSTFGGLYVLFALTAKRS
jgi:hypothetical protein